MHKPFLVEIELRVVNHPPKKKNVLGTTWIYIGMFRQVWKTLFLLLFLFFCCCFFWFLWVLDSLGLRRKPFLEINGVPVPVECSWSSLTGVLHIYTEMV